MRRKTIALAAVAILVAGMWALAAQAGEDAKFQKFQDNFWDAYFKFFPTEGTIQGFTKYNSQLENMKAGNIEKFLEGMDKFNQELITKIDVTQLSPDLQVDHEMFRDFLDQEVMWLENSLFRIENPLFYNDLFLNSLASLLTTGTGPSDTLIKSATERAKQIPGLVKNAKDNLKTPPREYTEAAIEQFPAILDFYRAEIPRLSGSSAALQAEVAKAITALEDYQRFLQGELLGKSTGNFRLGEFHLRILRMKSAGSLPILEEIVPRSLADFNNIHKAMGLFCLPYFNLMYPDIDPDQLAAQKGADEALRFVIQSVIDKLKVSHPSQDEYLNAIQGASENVKDFLSQNDLLDLPQDGLSIEPMPAFYAGMKRYHLAGPGAFQAAGPFTLYIAPVPSSLSPDEVTQYLEEHTNFQLNYLALQKVFPGSFVPSLITSKTSSIIQKMHPNAALIQGWPVGLGETMIFAGFQNFDLREKLNQLKQLLKITIDFQMDINVHQGTYSKDQVVGYMTRGGFMTQPEAERRYHEIVLNPCEAALTYIGYQEIAEMQKEYKASRGDAFSQKEFLQKILSFGPIPLRTIRMKLAQ